MTDTLPAGRELNVLVAKKVMGLTVTHVYGVPWLGGRIPGPIPDYSTEWDAMRLVVERLVALRCTVNVMVTPDGATCSVHRTRKPFIVQDAGTLPHAVALAALKAVTGARQGAEASRE